MNPWATTCLNDLAAGGLEVADLLAQGGGELEGLRLAGDVLAREAPVEHRHGPCAGGKLRDFVQHCNLCGLSILESLDEHLASTHVSS